jgi:hypothetical protein
LHLSSQGSINPSVLNPFLKPNKAIGITYSFVIPLKKKSTVFAFVPLASVPFTPADDRFTATAPA